MGDRPRSCRYCPSSRASNFAQSGGRTQNQPGPCADGERMKTAPSTLPLIALTCLRHPEQAVRHGLRGDLEQWLDTLIPVLDPSDLRAIIDDCRGTVIEPFGLCEDESYLAAL